MDGDLHDIHPAPLKMFQFLSLGRVLRTGFVSTANGTCCGIYYTISCDGAATRPLRIYRTGSPDFIPTVSWYPKGRQRLYGVLTAKCYYTNYSIPTSTKLEKSRTFTLSFRLVL